MRLYTKRGNTEEERVWKRKRSYYSYVSYKRVNFEITLKHSSRNVEQVAVRMDLELKKELEINYFIDTILKPAGH